MDEFLELTQQFLKREADRKTKVNPIVKEHELVPSYYEGPEPRSRIFAPGTRTGLVEVVARVGLTEQKLGRREGIFRLRCHAIHDGKECLKEWEEPYSKLFFSFPYSCGCTPRPPKPRRPPHHYEGLLFGRLEVLRWVPEEYAWECLCHECAALMFRANIKAIRQDATSCTRHRWERLKAPKRPHEIVGVPAHP